MASIGDNFKYIFPFINAKRGLAGEKKAHLSEDHKTSDIYTYFSAEQRKIALDELNEKYNLDYTTDLTRVNPGFKNFLIERETLLLDGILKNKAAKLKLGTSDEAKALAVLHPPTEMNALRDDGTDDQKAISIEALYDRITLIKKAMENQLTNDKKQIDALFENDSALSKALQAAPTTSLATPKAMTDEEVASLKADLLTSLDEAYKAAINALNQESDNQYKIAESEHYHKVTLAIAYKNDPIIKENLDKHMRAEAREKNEESPESGIASTVSMEGTGPLPLQKLNINEAKNVLLSEGITPITHEKVTGFRNVTGQFIRYDSKNGICKTQLPARIPLGPVARASAYVFFNTSLQGDSDRCISSAYYVSWQDNIKFDAKSMAGKLFAEGYREATICIDHNPKDPENKHALEVAQKFVEACCEEGFEIDKITVKINGHETPLFDKRNEKGEVVTKGVFKSEGELDAMANIAKKTFKEREKEFAQTPKMTQMGNEHKARLKEIKEDNAAAEAAKNTAPATPTSSPKK